ncbi:MAG: HAD family hydrolase [Planctomycetota bacterium]
MDHPRRTAAFVYDFDGTLAVGNVPEHSFLPRLGVEPAEFWGRVKAAAREQDADEILTYMALMVRLAASKGEAVTRESLAEDGRSVPFFRGVPEWFDRMDRHAAELELHLEHYVVSSGIGEMIESCEIAPKFRRIFASCFMYDEQGRATWPGTAVNYTTKTQYLFRINKGIDNAWDNASINRWIPEQDRPVPFSRMVFFGDGDTDVPSMKTVRNLGGHSIAVFDPAQWDALTAQGKVHRLIAEDRVNFVAPADFSESGQLDVLAKGVLGKIGRSSSTG